jgi:putative DNA primase/helicase
MSIEDFDQAKRRRLAEHQAQADVVQHLCQPPGRPYPNAELFLEARYSHIEHPLLVHQGGEWYRWDGACWPVFDQSHLRTELYEFFAGAVYHTGSETEPFRPFDPSRRKIDDLVDALKAKAYLPIETPVPSWLVERRLPPEELVGCSNGLVHWPTRTLQEHTPAYYAHHAVPFEFLPNAPPPGRWLSFLRELWGDDNESIAVLQEIFGYLVSGDTRLQKLFLVVGPKRSGKGTIARVLTAMLAKHHVAGPTLAGMGTNFGLSPLIGKPVAIVSDARLSSSDNTSVVTERLLSISGEDTLTLDRKYKDPWTGQLPSRIVILSNELPRLTDSSGALASRFVMLIMQRSFYGVEDPDLTKKLCTELSGIFNWALDGLERLRERGRFQQPAASEDAVHEMEDLSSPMGAFVRERCVVAPAHEVPCDTLYQAWRQWCQDHGRDRPGTTQTFSRDLRAVLPGLKVERPWSGGGSRPRVYVGIGLGSGDHNGAGRGPARTDWWDEAAVRDSPRTEPMYSPREDGLARSSTRSSPTDSPQENNNGPVRGPLRTNGANVANCAQCHKPITANSRYSATSTGEHLHTKCADLWLEDHPA